MFGNKDLERHPSIPQATLIWYIVHMAIILIIWAYTMRRTIKMIKEEFNSMLRDKFRLIQLFCIMSYLIIRTLFYFLLPIGSFEYYGFPTIAISVFIFYYFEIINNLCWITFILHIEIWKPDEMSQRVTRKIKKKEVILLIITATFVVLTLLSILVILLIALVKQCGYCKLYYFLDKQHPSCDEDFWNILKKISQNFNVFMFAVGCMLAIMKAIVGFILLKKMHK